MNGRISYFPRGGGDSASIIADGITIIGSGTLAYPYSSPYQVGDGISITGSGTLTDPFVSVGDGAVADNVTITGAGTGASPLSVNTNYFILADGKSGGQILKGGIASGQALAIMGNSVQANKVFFEGDGTLSVGASNYETLVTDDDDIPNKKYIDDEILKNVLIWS